MQVVSELFYHYGSQSASLCPSQSTEVSIMALFTNRAAHRMRLRLWTIESEVVVFFLGQTGKSLAKKKKKKTLDTAVPFENILNAY